MLSELWKKLCYLSKQSCRKKASEIELPEEPVYRELGAGAVNRIFSNIISNAMKYYDGDLYVVMDKSGCVTFSNTAYNLMLLQSADCLIDSTRWKSAVTQQHRDCLL